MKTAVSSNEAPASDLRYLKGVGPKRAQILEKLGITSISDLLYFFPRRHEDRSQFRKIAEIQPNEYATVCGEILKVRLKPLKRLKIIEVSIGDDSGMLYAVWFNQVYLKKQFIEGRRIILFGRVEWYQNRFQISSPEYELIEDEEKTTHAGRITPVYPLTEGLFQRSLRMVLKEAVDNQLEKSITEYLPESFRRQHGLMDLREAVRQMHFPTSFEELKQARTRIVFDEFLIFQLILFRKAQTMKDHFQAYGLQGGMEWTDRFAAQLPFTLTESQQSAINDLVQDLAEEIPMNRLLQGDVGSGKTMVAAYSLLLAAKNGFQGAFLIPTEVLAEQHFQTLKRLFAAFDLEVGLLTSNTPAPKREKMIAQLKQNKLSVVIGTHAILHEDIQFKALALVVIDEQHKFGVYQRCRLLSQNPRPHQLVMTATPIPRTLALTIYGDLKISVMKELPKGRQPIQTYWMTRTKQNEVLEHIGQKIKVGEQAYFIFPLIEETEKTDMLAAVQEYERLRKSIFKDIRMGLVHGKMSKEERDHMMNEFRQNKIQILVATSVVEVGVDHPNATMIVIENAERFGLAQLHQLRGRVGRGQKNSQCFLFGEPKTDEGKRRLRIMTKTQNGFVIAEEDLKLRGPGDFMGSRQSGEPYFKVGHPLLDEPILVQARQSARELIASECLGRDPEWGCLASLIEKISIQY